jgi:hypothetical protein
LRREEVFTPDLVESSVQGPVAIRKSALRHELGIAWMTEGDAKASGWA